MVPYFGRNECKQFMKSKPVNLDTNFGLLQLHSDMPFNFIFTSVKTTSLIQIWGLEDLQLTSSWWVCQNMQDLIIREKREREREGERGREKERERERKREKEGERGWTREKERERQRQGRGRGRENAPLKPIKDMKKLERGSTDVLIDDNAKIALVRCKNNKVVTVLSSNYGLNPTAKKNGTSRKERSSRYWAILMQLKNNTGMGGVDCLDQNIAMYMIAHRSKKWWVVVNLPFLCRSLCKWCISNLYKKERTQGKSNLASLDSDVVLLTNIIDVTEMNPENHVSRFEKENQIFRWS